MGNKRKCAGLFDADNQFGRRNLSPYIRAQLALKLKPMIVERAKSNQIAAGGAVPQKSSEPVETREELARIAGVSHDTIHKVEVIEKKAPEQVKSQLIAGDISIHQAYNDIRREEKREEIISKLESIEATESKEIEGVYDVIVYIYDDCHLVHSPALLSRPGTKLLYHTKSETPNSHTANSRVLRNIKYLLQLLNHLNLQLRCRWINLRSFSILEKVLKLKQLSIQIIFRFPG